MAGVMALQQPRRKKPVTYGKTSKNGWSLDARSEDELSLSTPKPMKERTIELQDRYTVSKPRATEHATTQRALKPIKPRKKKEDAWDVPSSGDENEESIKRRTPPKLSAGKRQGVNPAKKEAEHEQLAPWERKGGIETQSEQNKPPRKRHAAATSDAQLRSELTHSMQQDQDAVNAKCVPPSVQKLLPSASVSSSPMKPGSSAVERLKARKLASVAESKSHAVPTSKANQKRGGPDQPGLTATNPSPRKKLKAEHTLEDETGDIAMTDAPERLANSRVGTAQKSNNDADVYDLPSSSADESTRSSKKAVTIKSSRNNRRQHLAAASRSSARKMDSAPARLSDMIMGDLDSTDATSPSAVNSPPATPGKSTISSRMATPETALRHGGTLTPKQVRLWDNLLASEPLTVTPNVSAMQDLTLNTRRVNKTAKAPHRSLVKSSSDVGPRQRPKLVDRLKASAPSTDNDSGEQSDDNADDMDMSTTDNDEPEPAAEAPISQLSQGQSQSQGTGSRVTYASRTRSFLPEDSLEDGLMFSLSADTPQHKSVSSRQISMKSNTNSQKSAFDIDESDGEGQAGRIRTIHELRAGGVNQRFMDDIGGILGDISDHNASARSRRRSAMIELATKLVDSGFAERFMRQSYEQQLLAECAAARDDIADFALATAFAALLSHETPEHVARSLKDRDLLEWCGGLAQTRSDASKLAADRKNNMSKSAQKSFVQFVADVKDRQMLWGDATPTSVSTRTMALKVVDKLVGKLRRSGDRSELLKANDLRQILPEDNDSPVETDSFSIDLALAVSILEALSTTAISLTWPSDVVERLRNLLVDRRIGNQKSQHLLFLTLRLCLNLTNENARNCRILAKAPTVAVLLRAIIAGFENVHADASEEQRTINLDLLVLSMGILINLSEHNESARGQATTDEIRPLLSSIVDVFNVGQQRLTEAESVEQGVTNVAYGYLAVVLANLCRNREAKAVIASKLPGRSLKALLEALAEFVHHHQAVDIKLEGEEGMEVWRAFTEKLKEVLRRLQAEAALD